MAVRKRGSGYLADFMVNGTRYRETFTTEVEAKAWELEARAALTVGKPLPPVSNGRTETGGGLSTLGALFDYTCVNHWQNNPKVTDPATAIAAARGAVDHFGRGFKVRDITTETMKELIRAEAAKGHSFATCDRKLSGLSKMLNLAAEKGVIQAKPKVPFTRETNERIRFLSYDEARRLLDLWMEWDQPELHAFTVFGLHTGARLGALLKVKWTDFAPGYTKVIFTTKDKKSNVRTLPMSKIAIEAMEFMRSRNPEGAGPFSHFKEMGHLRTMWDAMRDHTGWGDVVIHTLRHTCATWMLEKSGNLKKVQTWLGHRNIATTLKYAKLVTGALDDMASVTDDALARPKPSLKVIEGGSEGT
jgi:integrase